MNKNELDHLFHLAIHAVALAEHVVGGWAWIDSEAVIVGGITYGFAFKRIVPKHLETIMQTIEWLDKDLSQIIENKKLRAP